MIRGMARARAEEEKEKELPHADPLRFCQRCGSTFFVYYHAQVLCDHCQLERMQTMLRKYSW